MGCSGTKSVEVEDNVNNNGNNNDRDILDNIKEKRLEHEEILEKLDLEKLKEKALKAPKRTKSKLIELVEYLKKTTIGMDEFEKGYIIFYWLHENIEYDIINKGSDKVDNTPDGTYKNGKCVCEGYARLYKYIGLKIGSKFISFMVQLRKKNLINLHMNHMHGML